MSSMGKAGGGSTKGGRGKPKVSKLVSRLQKARLQFLVGRIARFLKVEKYAERVGASALVYLSAMLENLTTEWWREGDHLVVGNTEIEDYNRERGVYLLAFLVMPILNAYYCHASAVQVKGNTTLTCNDGLGECLFIEDEWNPYERRMLYPLKPQSQNPHKPPVPCGGKKDSYASCINADCLKRSPYNCCRLQKS